VVAATYVSCSCAGQLTVCGCCFFFVRARDHPTREWPYAVKSLRPTKSDVLMYCAECYSQHS
jgi:hypothetical protein